MSFPSNVENSVKEEKSDMSFVQNEGNLAVNKEHVFTFVPLQEEKYNKFSENNTDLKSESHEEIKPDFVLHECVKTELTVQTYGNNLKETQQDPVAIHYSDMENSRREYTSIVVIKEEFTMNKQEKHEDIDVVERKVESPVTNDNTTINLYGCSIPGNDSNKRDILSVTGQMIHKRIKSYECHVCHKLLSTTRNLKMHVENLHKGIKKYKCVDCERMFSQYGNLKTHINIVHKGIKKYECKECHKIISGAGYLKKHIESVHEGIKHECNECHMLFTLHMNLKRHINIVHNGVKKYECNDCFKMFSQR